jgi:DNA-binding NarL/FixJ family response regulator
MWWWRKAICVFKWLPFGRRLVTDETALAMCRMLPVLGSDDSPRVFDETDEVLLGAIRHAIERSHAALRHEAQTQPLRERYASLSRREREVMGLVVSGRLNKEVGGELGISEITVQAHRGRVMQKMRPTRWPPW